MPLLHQSLFYFGAWVELQEFGWVFTWWISGFCFFARQNFCVRAMRAEKFLGHDSRPRRQTSLSVFH